MYLEFHGASDGVTGSLHRIHANGVDVILDCGLFQGHRADANRRNRNLPDWAQNSEAAILSHAHLDHSGNLPSLVRLGFGGNIYCTPPTRDLCSVMLRDSAIIQTQDARYLNKHRRSGEPEVQPLYDTAQAQRAVSQMISVPLHRPLPVAPGITATFHNAGHVLGSALVELEISERGRTVRLLYTGDLGRPELPLLSSPEIVPNIDFLLMESTYGNRLHDEIKTAESQLANIVRDTIGRGGRVYIPTFALERAQEILFALRKLHRAGRIPSVPIYIDSPLAIAVTEIYKLHPEELDEHICEQILARDDPFSPPGLEYLSHVDDSRRVQESEEPCIIIAGSGMCEGGRIVFHLARGLASPNNSVAIVGFMAKHTLGRRLIEGRRKVKVLGVPREVRAHVHSLNGLSAHADRDGLLGFARSTAAAGQLRRIALVHGEDDAANALGATLRENGLGTILQSAPGRRIEL